MPVGPAVPPPPRWLPDGPSEVWRELAAPLQNAGRLWSGNYELLAAYCQTAFELRRLAVEIDGAPLADRGPHGPVCSGSVAVALKLRAVLALLAAKIGLDFRGGLDAPLPVDRPLSPFEQWQQRHPPRQA